MFFFFFNKKEGNIIIWTKRRVSSLWAEGVAQHSPFDLNVRSMIKYKKFLEEMPSTNPKKRFSCLENLRV